jgi:hypothetical protein
VEKEVSSKFPSIAPVIPQWQQCYKVIDTLLKEDIPGSV